MKKRINCRQKGCRVEREAAKYLQSLGFNAQRAARNGIHNGHDLIHDIRGAHIEVKGDESIDIGRKSLELALDQADLARGERQTAFVLWKNNRKGWRLSKRTETGIWTATGDSTIKAELLKHTGDEA